MFRNVAVSTATRRCTLGVTVTSDEQVRWTYRLSLSADPGTGEIAVDEEHLSEDRPEVGERPLFNRTRGSANLFEDFEDGQYLLAPAGVPLDPLLLGASGLPASVMDALRALRAVLAQSQVYPALELNPTWARRGIEPPSAMRGSVIIRPATSLERGGANLPNAYQALRNRGDDTWTRVRETLALGLGDDVVDVQVDPDPGGGQIGLSLVFRSVGKVPAFALSDGQLAFLAFVAITEFEGGRDGLVGLDEPDLHQHPALLAYTVALAERLSRQRTVVITTHSDRLLDALSDPGGAVVLVERDDRGRTRARRPDPTQLATWLEDYNGLGSLRADGYASRVFTESAGPPAAEGP